jgi:tetratricopeptide (TPR) repeat protein
LLRVGAAAGSDAELNAAESDALGTVRDALARQDWQAAFDAAGAATVASSELEASRADMLAEAAWWLGRLDDCITARELAYRLFDELGDHRHSGQCAVWLYEHHGMAARPAVANGWLRRARRALEDDPECIEHGALLLREAETAHGAADFERGLSLATDVIALGRRLRSHNLEAEALQTKGRLLVDRGDVAEGMGHLDEAMLFAIEGRLGPYSTGKVYCSLISACEELGDLDRAAEWTEATMQWARRHPFAIFPGICRVHRAVVLKRRGALAEAEREAMQASEELARSHIPNGAAAYAEVGDIRRRLGDLDRAEEAFTTAQELCGRSCGEVALLRLAQGRTDAAMTIITGCLRDASSPLSRARLLPIHVHVAVAAGDLDAASGAVSELDGIVATFDTRSPRARATRRGRRSFHAARGGRELAHARRALRGGDRLDAAGPGPA